MTGKERLVLVAAAVAAAMTLGLGGLALGAFALGSNELALMFGGASVAGATGVAGTVTLLARNGRGASLPPTAIMMTRQQIRDLRNYNHDDFPDEPTEVFAQKHGISIAPEEPSTPAIPPPPLPRRR